MDNSQQVPPVVAIDPDSSKKDSITPSSNTPSLNPTPADSAPNPKEDMPKKDPEPAEKIKTAMPEAEVPREKNGQKLFIAAIAFTIFVVAASCLVAIYWLGFSSVQKTLLR